MILTVGSLVKETSTRVCWSIASSLYVLACFGSSQVLGTFLGGVGILFHGLICGFSVCTPTFSVGYTLIGSVAVAYALSDVGWIHLPRPRVMNAVPVTWWRKWRPYGASLAYGAALGLGVMTRVKFGAFYVLCLWCIVKGDVVYGSVLMGTYGLLRALVLIPISWRVYEHSDLTTCQVRLTGISRGLNQVKFFIGGTLLLFGVVILVSTFSTFFMKG